MKDQILLNGMEFYGHHGCSEAEQKRGQVFKVDAVLNLDLSKAGKSDNINDTVDYALVLDLIKKVVTGKPKNLIESVAEDIAGILLEKFSIIESVKITIHKPSAPLANVFESAAVSIVRNRIEVTDK